MAIKPNINRRQFAAGFGAVFLTLGMKSVVASGENAGSLRYFSCANDGKQNFAVCLCGDGRIVWSTALPGRGHDIAVHPSGETVAVFARRAGTFARILDAKTGVVLSRITSSQGQHFYGHGVWLNADRLAITANDYEREQGGLAIWNTRNPDLPEQIDLWPTFGIGPHDLALLPEQRLVVANGGILTHPDMGRAKLNIPDMKPSLVYLDSRSGHLLDNVQLPAAQHKQSIRHLDVRRDGLVLVGMQHQGPKTEHPHLVAIHHAGDPLRFLLVPPEIVRRTKNYVGSVAFDSTGRVAAASYPRGGLILLWAVATGEFLEAVELQDGCGIARTTSPDDIIATSGMGTILDTSGKTPLQRTNDLRWDNHLAI